MQAAAIAAAVALSASAAFAQGVMDRSDRFIGAEGIANQLSQMMVADQPDPFSAQFVQLSFMDISRSTICGFVNLKNAAGAYTGFKPFSVDLPGKKLRMGQAEGCPAFQDWPQ